MSALCITARLCISSITYTAVLLGQQIFCVHGGVPSPETGFKVLSDINSIPVPLNDAENESRLAWELMWNDPVK